MARMRIKNVAEVAAPGGVSGPRKQSVEERPAPSRRSGAALTPPSNPAAKQSPQAAARRQSLIRRISSERWRMASSLLLSLLIHGLLLSLTFGGQGLGFPGLGFPWQERRAEVPELRVLLVPSPVTLAQPAGTTLARPTQPAASERPVAVIGPRLHGRRTRRPRGVPPSSSCRRPNQRHRPSRNEAPWPLQSLRKRLCAPPVSPLARRP